MQNSRQKNDEGEEQTNTKARSVVTSEERSDEQQETSEKRSDEQK